MRKLIFVLCLMCIIIISACSVHRYSPSSKSQPKKAIAEMDFLLDRAFYFKVRELFALDQKQIGKLNKLRLNVTIYSVFNQPEVSNQTIKLLFKQYKNKP